MNKLLVWNTKVSGKQFNFYWCWESFSYLSSGLLLYVGRDESIYTYTATRNHPSCSPTGDGRQFSGTFVWPFLEFRIMSHVSPCFFLFFLRIESIIAFGSLLPHGSGDHGGLLSLTS